MEKPVQSQRVPALQVGFNNNVRHMGRVFHIQTEDSGVNRPHITTHLFADGGRILRSERLDYSELLGAPDFVAQLRKRMKEQHRAMFVALRGGHFDEIIGELPGGEESPRPGARATNVRKTARVVSRPPKSNRPRAALSENGTRRPTASTKAPRSTPPRAPSNARPSTKSSGNHVAARPSLAGGGSANSLFGGSIREQSLDDVILSYISEDLDGE